MTSNPVPAVMVALYRTPDGHLLLRVNTVVIPLTSNN